MTNLQETGPSIFLKMFRFRSFICIAVTGLYYPYLLVTQSWRIKITHRLSTGCKTLKIAAYSHFDSWAKISDWTWENVGAEIKSRVYHRCRHSSVVFPAKWFTFTLHESDSDLSISQESWHLEKIAFVYPVEGSSLWSPVRKFNTSTGGSKTYFLARFFSENCMKIGPRGGLP